MPRRQQNERSALTLLALLDLKPSSNWQEIDRPLRGITPIMEYTRAHYGREYAPNTRETLRRQTMHHPEEVEHRFRRKWNSESGKWNTESGGSGTSIPEEVEQRFRRS